MTSFVDDFLACTRAFDLFRQSIIIGTHSGPGFNSFFPNSGIGPAKKGRSCFSYHSERLKWKFMPLCYVVWILSIYLKSSYYVLAYVF